MRKKIYLPKSFDELKKMSFERQSEIWNNYVLHPYKMQIKALWYYIQCDNLNLKIEQKYLVKIKKYSENPNDCLTKSYSKKYNLLSGSEIIKTFRGLEFKVVVQNENEFLYNGKIYKTLSAVAKEICGIKVSGPDFFGLNNKHAKENKNGED